MHKSAIAQQVFLIVFMFLSACGSNPDVRVDEVNNKIVSYDETIHINNCGGKADSEQTASRSFATNIEGGIEVGVQQIVEGSISAKYSQYRNVSKSQRLIAPPATNMEFILRWSEDVHAGNVTVNGAIGTYEVRVPVSVEQISSQDFGCTGNVQVQPPSLAGSTEVPTRENPTQIAPPSATPIPLPTSIPDTVPGTILELGQMWYQGNKAIRVNNIQISSSDFVFLELDIKNIGAQIITFQLSPENFVVTNNRGQRGSVYFGWVQSPLTLQPGESYSIGGSAPWIRVQELSVSDISVSELIISISFSNITNAQWRSPIYH